MKDSEAKELARGIAAICMPNAFDKTRPRPFNHEEVRQYSQEMLDKLYSIFLHMDDEQFVRRLKQAGSFARDIWREPEEVSDLLKDDFSVTLDHIGKYEKPLKK